MAKKSKPDMSDLFQKTDSDTLRKGRRRPIGVYLKNDVYNALEEIAQKENVSNHALIAYAVSEFIRGYKSGKIKLQTQTKTTLKTDI